MLLDFWLLALLANLSFANNVLQLSLKSARLKL